METRLMHALSAAAVATVLCAATAPAQNRRLSVFADAGGFSALENLNSNGSADFKTGFNLGTGVGWELRHNVSIRGDLTWGQHDIRNNGAVLVGQKVNEFFYGADIAFRYPNSGRAAPYAFVGAGAMTLHPKGTSGENKTKAFGRFGLGVNYQPAHSRIQLFAEGTGLLYKVSGFPLTSPLAGYNRTQFDLAYTGGLSLQL